MAIALRLGLMILLGGMLIGCKKPMPPDYGRALPEGTFGLRRIVDPARWPDLSVVVDQQDKKDFREAAERSLRWYGYPSSGSYFPVGPISLVHAQTSVYAMLNLGSDRATVEATLHSDFDVWESVGWDGSGEVLFTGYYTPVFRASRMRTGEYRFPLYERPPDLVSDPLTGRTLGRQTTAGVIAYPSRRKIESSHMLAGRELVYLPSRLDAYIIEVNGSAKLNMTDGSTLYIGYSGTNGHEYTSIGRLLVEDDKLGGAKLSLPAIRDYFSQHPYELSEYIRRNDRFVFFGEYDGTRWPAGSMGFRVTPMRSLATDKNIFPRGCVVLVNTRMPAAIGDRTFDQVMVDQDTGGAIRAAGRGDIYIGIGRGAEGLAGRQAATGQLYYLLLKRDKVQAWYDRMIESDVK